MLYDFKFAVRAGMERTACLRPPPAPGKPPYFMSLCFLIFS